jgi:hypothetical protein
MDVKPKYTEAGYDIDEDFVESIQQFDIRTGQKIAEFIQKNVNDIEPNVLVSTMLAGVIINDNNNPITFVVEVIKDHSPNIILSDLVQIDMDEYLDLINLKSNGKIKSRRNKKYS